eukprot:superscaffoldBa00005800_g20791
MLLMVFRTTISCFLSVSRYQRRRQEEVNSMKRKSSVEDGGSLGLLLCYTEDQTEEEREARSSTPDQEHLTPLDYDTASRSVSPIVQSDRRSAGRRRTSEPQDHVDLRIRILEDSQISVLSNNVFQKYPLQELQCPLGLQESDFLDLLRSTFPQLAADQPFDIFTTDHSRKLQPLRVATLTPEKIYNRIRSTGYSALYIRLKEQEEPPVGDKELRPLQREDADPPSDSITITTNDKTTLYTRLSSPTVRSDRKKRGRRRTSEPQDHVDLRICILEDSEISVLSTNVFRKYPLQELQCPLGLDESDFLDLLRSTFPQLAADQPFDVFTTNHSRKLQPLRVDTLTPEEIYDRIRSTGYSALYIRLKHLQSTDEELQPSQRDAADPQTGNTRLSSPRVQSDRRSAHRRRTSEPQNHVDLRIRILEDSQISVLSTNVFQKYPLQELRCPLGLQESDFLDLLRSTFPQLAADRPFDIFTCDRAKRLQPLTVKTLTPEEIDRTIRSTGAGTSALYIRLKEQAELKKSQKDDAAGDSPSAADESRLLTKSVSLTVQSDRKSAARRRISELQDHIDLRIRILEDSQISVLSTAVFQKYPLRELQCPLGLQESDFLDLLRSTFPQLAAHQPFDVFTTDHSRKLQPLRVATLTPEEIYNKIRSTGQALYIRLKDLGTKLLFQKQEETHHLQRKTDSPSTSDQTSLNTNSHDIHVQQREEDMETEEADDDDYSTRLEPAKGFLVLSESEGDRDDDWEKISEKTKRRVKRSGVKTNRRKLIQSSMEELVEKSDALLSCTVCRVLRGSLNMLIKHAWSHVNDPQGVCGVCGEHSESAEELRSHLQSHQKTHSCNICEMYFISASGLKGHMARHRREKTDLSERRRRGRPRLGEEPSHHYVRVCMLEDSQSQVLSKNVLLKSPVQDLKCPRGLQEADFLVLLRSAFPQLAGDDKPFNVFKSDRSRRLQRLRVKTLTPEEIYRAMKSTGVEKTVLYIRLKRNDDAANESPKSDEADLHSSPVQPPDGSSSTSQQQQQDMKTEEADDEADVSDDDKDGDEDDWKPDPELQSLKTRKRRAKRCGMEGKLAEKSKTPCKVISYLLSSPGVLKRPSASGPSAKPSNISLSHRSDRCSRSSVRQPESVRREKSTMPAFSSASTMERTE